MNSSSDEEESKGEQTTSGRWEAAVPPSPRVERVVTGLMLEAGAEPPVVGSKAEAPVGAAEAPPSPRGSVSEASPS
jgi:hypothetical protein